MTHRGLVMGWLLALAIACSADSPPANQAPPTDSLALIEDRATEEIGGPDLVLLKDGQKVYGSVVSENRTVVVIGQRSGTFTVARKLVKQIQRGVAPSVKAALATSTRLPAFVDSLVVVGRQGWAADLRQIPATVIEIGALRNIPYVSHRSGSIEFNVYGDPQHPAAVEVGVYGRDPKAKIRESLRAFMADLLTDPADKAALLALDLHFDKREREGLTFEIAPPTDPDSFGGWWVTVFDPQALDGARASDAEMAELVVAPPPEVKRKRSTAKKPPVETTALKAEPTFALPPEVAGSSPDIAIAPSPEPSTPTTAAPSDTALSLVGPADSSSGWTPSHYSYSSKPSSSGAVYVRGYTRKDGTYVRPHTRSRPRR